MACETWTYRNVSAKVFQNLKIQAQKQGFQIPDTPSGRFHLTVAGMNLVFQYHWHSPTGILKLTCIEKPMMIGCGIVRGYADKIVAQCGGSK